MKTSPASATSHSFEALFGAHPQPMFLYAADTLAILAANAAACTLYGGAAAQWRRRVLPDLHPDEERDALRRWLQTNDTATTPRPGGAWRHRRRDGSLFQVGLLSYPVQMPDGRGHCLLVRPAESEDPVPVEPDGPAALFDLVRDSIVVLDMDFAVCGWNRGATRLFGFTQKEMQGRSCLEALRVALPSPVAEVMECLRRAGHWEGTLTATSRDGCPILAETHWALDPGTPDRPPSMIVSCRDITAAKQAESRLRDSEKKYRTVLEQAPVGVAHIGLDGHWLWLNNRFCDMLGYSQDQLVGTPFLAATHPEDRPACADLFQQFSDGNLTSVNVEKRYLRRDDRVLWAAVSAVAICDADDTPQHFLVFAIDITGRKRVEEALHRTHDELEKRVRARTADLARSNQALHELSLHTTRVREAERARIAREIHDELGGLLTGLKYELSLNRRRNDGENSLPTERARRPMHMADEAIASLRRIINDLRPSVLDTLGLWAALEWQAQNFQENTAIACHFALSGPERQLETEAATAVFRIVQEALTNVIKHARASRVRISAHMELQELVLTIADNGLGIQPDQVANTRSFGLLGMRERARLINGRIRISGRAGRGTSVTLRLPVSTQPA